jgi:monoamine oxidase
MKPTLAAALARRAGASRSGWTRRDFLQTTLAAGAALMLSGRTLRAAGGIKPRVLIIGAGFGGLSCGYQLRQAGAEVTLLEARNRVGGRVLSLDNFIKGRVVEGGAELIGSNHPTWMAYGERFGLEFRDVTEGEDESSPILINGKRYIGEEAAELWEGLAGALNLMNDEAHKVNLERPWETSDAQKLDNTSLQDAAAKWDVPDVVRQAALCVLKNDNVSWPETSSYLGLLTQIAGGGYEEFWTESEVYRCIGGNQTLAFRLADAIGADRIKLGTAVNRVDLGDTQVTVRTADGAKHEADYVVLTVPPPAWKNFEITPAVPDRFRTNTGPAIKYLSAVSRPFWIEDGLEAKSLSDTPVGETWEGTDAQRDSDDEPACLTVFSGGQAAQDCLDFPAETRREEFAKRLEVIYPGFGRHVEQALFMGWPNERWTLTGYSTPALGQITGVYPHFAQGFHERLQFAGEYTSWRFPGFMEGGLHSGAALAGRLARKLNLTDG